VHGQFGFFVSKWTNNYGLCLDALSGNAFRRSYFCKQATFLFKTKQRNLCSNMSSEAVGRGRGTKRKVDQTNNAISKKLRGELSTPVLGPNK
jgi:hypothetical protein